MSYLRQYWKHKKAERTLYKGCFYYLSIYKRLSKECFNLFPRSTTTFMLSLCWHVSWDTLYIKMHTLHMYRHQVWKERWKRRNKTPSKNVQENALVCSSRSARPGNKILKSWLFPVHCIRIFISSTLSPSVVNWPVIIHKIHLSVEDLLL